MFAARSQAIRELLGRGAEALEAGALADLVAAHQATGRALAELAVERGLIGREALLRRVADHLGWPYVDAVPAEIPAGLRAALTAEQARTYGVVPWRRRGDTLELLAVDPFNCRIVDELAPRLGHGVALAVADPAAIEVALRRGYGEEAAEWEDLRDAFSEGAGTAPAGLAANELEALAGQAPIVRFVNRVLAQAIRDQASDIHFEPFESEFKIRCRIDGALCELPSPPHELALPVISRLKVLANLDIAERRLPQDGRIRSTLAGRSVDLRVSTLPTQFGESVVLRVLDRSSVQLELGQLGLPDDMRAGLEDVIRRPNGIFVVTGPTGSGKTTTLYSALRAINTPGAKLLTAEDPVEYEIDGIMQVPVNAGGGPGFAAALRSFLRQDPDVIMVGEIRDLETAQVAIQAALTGHLVLSTLHTNDAPGTITRLVDLGVEPFLIAAALEAVLAQRLVRRICPQCREAYQPEEALLRAAGIERAALADRPFHRGRGCPHCRYSGYRGRRGIFEWLRLSEPVRELVAARAPAAAIRDQALAEGMRSLRDQGLAAVLDGTTTIEEVLKCT